MFIGRTDAEAETPILWPPDVKNWLIGKDPDTGGNRWQKEKGMTDVDMAGWHHRLDGHEFGWTLGVGDEQGGLVCYDSWDHKESDTTEWLNWTELNWTRFVSAQVNRLQHAVPVQQGYTKLQPTTENTTHPKMDSTIRTMGLRLARGGGPTPLAVQFSRK